MITHDAVILAGGRSTRLDGQDKGDLTVAGERLIETAMSAAGDARRVVVVGTRAPHGARAVTEEPRFGGPAAALTTGVRELARGTDPAPWVLALACDLPGSPRAVPDLLTAAQDLPDDLDGLIAVDGSRRLQWLLALYRRDAVDRAARALGDPTDQPLHRLLGNLHLRHLKVDPRCCTDIDTWDDLARWHAESSAGGAR